MLLGVTCLLTACGGNETKEAAAPKKEEVVKIGATAPLTGPLAIYGVTATNGSKLAMEEINKNGGVLGKKVDFVVLDSKGDSTEAVMAYNRLVDEGMVAFIGDAPSKPSLAIAEVAAQDNMPMIMLGINFAYSLNYIREIINKHIFLSIYYFLVSFEIEAT